MWIYKKIKNREAPFIWRNRIIQPKSISRMIWITDSNASDVWAIKFIDNIKPEIICNISVIPNKNPKFQRNEIENGVGKFNKELLTILYSGLCFFKLNLFIFVKTFLKILNFMHYFAIYKILDE